MRLLITQFTIPASQIDVNQSNSTIPHIRNIGCERINSIDERPDNAWLSLSFAPSELPLTDKLP
jgi:hypothetical protein